MATAVLARSRRTAGKLQAIGTAFARSFSSLPSCRNLLPSSSLLRLRPLVTVPAGFWPHHPAAAAALRGFATRQTYSSLNDSNPNFSNRPPKETILLDGCDFEHWLIVMERPQGDPTRDEIIDSYIKVLAQVVGSEEEARMKIYSVSTRHYFAFGALVSEEVSYKIKELDNVRWVLPDSYLDVKNKDYGGEPFIDGQAVPYDPKYHEEWVRNNARATERNRRNDRPRNFDRSRNFDRRQMANPNAQNPGPGPNNYRPSSGPTQHGSSPPGPNQINNAPMPNQNGNAPWPPTQNHSPPGPPQNYSPPGPIPTNVSPSAPSQNNHSTFSHGHQNFPPVPGQGYSTPGQMQNYPPGPGQNYPPRQSYAPPPPGPGQSYAPPPPGPGQSYAPPGQSYSPPPGPGQSYAAPPRQSYSPPPPGPNQSYAPAPNQNQAFTQRPNEDDYVPNMEGRNAY